MVVVVVDGSGNDLRRHTRLLLLVLLLPTVVFPLLSSLVVDVDVVDDDELFRMNGLPSSAIATIHF